MRCTGIEFSTAARIIPGCRNSSSGWAQTTASERGKMYTAGYTGDELPGVRKNTAGPVRNATILESSEPPLRDTCPCFERTVTVYCSEPAVWPGFITPERVRTRDSPGARHTGSAYLKI